MRNKLAAILACMLVSACVSVGPIRTPGTTPSSGSVSSTVATRYVRVTVRGNGRQIDAGEATFSNDYGTTVACDWLPQLACRVGEHQLAGTGGHLAIVVPGFQPYAAAMMIPIADLNLADIDLVPIGPRPVPGKVQFVREYQGNFGSIKLVGCGLPFDSLFDPFLLTMWTYDRRCFDAMMQAHAARGDTRIVVDPRADYHGQLPTVDLYHDPTRFAAFLDDVRAYRNINGEPFEVLLFLAADGHIGSFIGANGRRDLAAEGHWRDDVGALLDVIANRIPAVTPCWECRHQRDYMRPDTYAMMLSYLRDRLPDAWIGVHLIEGSSSVSSWRCDPATDASCDPSEAEPDDQFRGSEPGFWQACRARGICDGLLYQANSGDEYTNPDAHPNYTGHPGAFGRWFEVVTRLGNDPRSQVSSGGDRHGWVQADVIMFEHIYDAYNNRSTEAYGISFCQQALRLGGWACGSASYRLP